MRHHGLLGDLLRLSKLQACGACGYTWYARGHWRSPRCPNCHRAVLATRSSFGGGCLTTLVVTFGLVLGMTVLGQVGEHKGPEGVVDVLALGGAATITVMVLRRRAKRRREDKARRELEAAQRAADEAHRAAAEARVQYLVAGYGDATARLILEGKPWQGATGAMIREMLGEPAEVSQRVYKTKTKETWKYDPIDARRYRLHIMLENGVCVGWKTGESA